MIEITIYIFSTINCTPKNKSEKKRNTSKYHIFFKNAKSTCFKWEISLH